MKKLLLVSAVVLSVFAAGCDGCRDKGADDKQAAEAPKPEPVTGLKIQVKNAEGKPVLSRVAITRAGQSGYAARVTETWVQATTTGTVVEVPAGEYVISAQGTGDSFMRTESAVEEDKLSEVSLGFATLVLSGDAVKEQGRVRVWQHLGEGGKQIVVTRLIRPDEKAPLALASGKYSLGFLPEGLTDEDENFTVFETGFELAPGTSKTVEVKTP